MKQYLTTLLIEKGYSLDDEITIPGHWGLTYSMLFDFIEVHSTPEVSNNIRSTLMLIDVTNGDVFHYFTHLAEGMIKSCENSEY